MKFTIANYRNISPDNPLQFEIKEGITFILGPNNAGKTNILKFLYDIRPIIRSLSFHHTGLINQNTSLSKPFDQTLNRRSGKEEIYFTIENETRRLTCLLKRKGFASQTTIETDLFVDLANTPETVEFINSLKDNFSNFFFIGSLRNSQNSLTGESFDLPVGQNFIQKWSEWADGEEIRNRTTISSLKKELQEILAYNRFEIRLNHKKDDLIINNDDGEFALTELGNGISHFIVALATATIYKPSFICIDEPEISLHPRLQELFVRALAAKASKGLIATSHSIALARSVGDSIYLLTRGLENLEPIIEPYGQHFKPTIAQAISEMSYSQYVEIGGNNILLVEGKTDIKCFREILRKYAIESKFIILSFGGSQFMHIDKTKIIEELNEINRLKPNSVSVIFDSEKSNPTAELKPEFKAFKETCEELGFHVFPTDKHSTENYITQNALNKILGGGYLALQPYENFKKATNKWAKEKNWLMFREMTKADIDNSELGNFIQSTLIPLSRTNNTSLDQ